MNDGEGVGNADEGEGGMDKICTHLIVVSSEFWNVYLGKSRSSICSWNESKEEDKE